MLKITDLKCEYRTNPIGIENDRPILQWIVRNAPQKAYRVCAASRESLLEAPDLWDSGRIETYETKVVYDGAKIFAESGL